VSAAALSLVDLLGTSCCWSAPVSNLFFLSLFEGIFLNKDVSKSEEDGMLFLAPDI
jgi:hypothetical protein